MPEPLLSGHRILVVEDEYFLAEELATALRGAGASVVGPVASVAAAQTLLETGPVDAAALDVNLGGDEVYPLADALATRGIPFLFTSGFDSTLLLKRFRSHLCFEKPVDIGQVLAALAKLVSESIHS